MTQDEIIEMARQAVSEKHEREFGTWLSWEELETFAKLVAAKERYACMNICLNFSDVNSGPDGIEQDYHAKLIKARGEA